MSKQAEGASAFAPDPAKAALRAPWQQPVLRALSTDEAETGVNSTADATATFS
ncbi:MAG: hypothetical protein WDM91_21270 [Rhizomicrobium sp.]